MQKIQKLRTVIPARTRWLVCLLATVAGVFAATVSFGLGGSAQATGGPGAPKDVASTKSVVHTASVAKTTNVVHTMAQTTAIPTIEATSYSGGRLMSADPSGGYWTVSWVGAVTSYGGAPTFGSPVLSGIKLAKPIVGMAATPDGQGYWLVGSDGGVFSYGDAKFYGSTGAIHLNQPIVNIESTPNGLGYWLVASDGGVFTYGNAKFYGSTGNVHLNKPIVGMAATTSGTGYWLVASDGGVFSFGNAKFYGSTGNIRLNQPIAGMAPTPDGTGYWLVASDGGIFTFGDAKFSGSLGGTGKSVIGIMVNPTTSAYNLVEGNGTAVVPTITPVAAGQAPTAPGKTTTTSPPSGTTTPTTPTASGNGSLPSAPASLGAPSTMVLDDEFNTGSLNTALWSPNWFGSGSVSNGTVMLNSNVSVGSNGLALQLNSPQSGGLVSTNPDDHQAGHTGFQIAPTPGNPVFVEFKATLPADASGNVANWPALWLDGQTWPEDGEIDVMEGGYGYTAFHVHYGTGSGSAQGATVNNLSGTHTYGVLWTTTGFTFLYDGAVVGTVNVALTSPMYLIMENSYSSVDPTVFPATMDVRYVRVWN
jgi:ribosomal protein L24E